MPKITGPNIAQHVADQEAAVFAAAVGLFAVHGVDGVSMGTIAEEVGLARSSLYRYFPNKAAIVDRWSSMTMQPLIDESDQIARSGGPRAERFTAWVERQIEFLSDPANQTMIRAALANNEMSDHQRAVIAARHRDLYATLHSILGGPDRDDDVTVRARVRLIVGLLRSVDDLQHAEIPAEVVHDEVMRIALLAAELE
jgi:AcrR family transcriptional regulator